MAFCRQMHDGIRLMRAKHPFHFRRVANIHTLERITRAEAGLFQRVQVCRIRQFVHIHHMDVSLPNKVADNGRADEAGSTRDKDFHEPNFKPGIVDRG